MNEDFLAFLWKFRKLGPDLTLQSGEPLVILAPGTQNLDGGPDFFNARLRIGETIWAGNVEIHVRSSDWQRHGHSEDPLYQNAILHVVLTDDSPVRYPDGTPMPTLVLTGNYPPGLYERFRMLGTGEAWIPCYNQLRGNPPHAFELWSPSLAVERLVMKSDSVRQRWENCLYNWDEAFYRQMAWCFGFRVNNEAFDSMACSLPLKIVQQNCRSLPMVEALVFGVAGLLEDPFTDEYPLMLQRDFKFLEAKYQLKPIRSSYWKFLRMRPSNFPTIRLSQWAGLLTRTSGRFFQLLEHGDIPEIFTEGEIVTSPYWFNHYLFDKPSVFQRKSLGKESIDLLMINGIAPFLFFYGLEKDIPPMREKALGLLERLPPESNGVINRWKELGFPCMHALHTQALLHLKQHWCDKKRCLECRIGIDLLSGQ